MVERPLYPKVVAGYEENERGKDALVLAERVVARDGGELNVVQVEKGSPADALGALAEKGEADLVVLGSTHHAAFGSVAPGSVAEHLLQGARCRLIIAPKGYAKEDHSQDRLRVLAVGYDGMAESQAALDEAAVLAGKFGASMKVVGVMTPIPPMGAAAAAQAGPESGPDFQSRLRDAVAELPGAARPAPAREGQSGPQAARGGRDRGGSPGPRFAWIRARDAPADRQCLLARDPGGPLPGDGDSATRLGLPHPPGTEPLRFPGVPSIATARWRRSV